jgi:hypothetical protein
VPIGNRNIGKETGKGKGLLQGAEAMASKNLGEFLNDIETCLKNK